MAAVDPLGGRGVADLRDIIQLVEEDLARVEEIFEAQFRSDVGLLVSEPLDPEQTRAWVQPCLSDAGIRQDVARFAREVDSGEFPGPEHEYSANGSAPAAPAGEREEVKYGAG